MRSSSLALLLAAALPAAAYTPPPVVIATSGPSEKKETPAEVSVPMPIVDVPKSANAFVAASNAFALDAYGKLRGGDGDFFFSPYSITSALAITSAGARGETLAEMAKALHLPRQEELHPAAQATAARLGKLRGVELSVGNALWIDKSLPIRDEFRQVARTRYAGTAWTVDFRGNAESARGTINKWTEDRTRKRISDLLPPGVLTPYTRLVVTNAVYFKGTWDNDFEKSSTHDDDFTRADGTKVKKPFMHTTDTFGYAAAKGVQVLEMDYKGGEASMVVLLPSRDSSLAEFEKTLPKRLDGLLAAVSRTKVVVTVPKFTTRSAMSLKDMLRAMGMTKAFEEYGADFTGISEPGRLHIVTVLHKAFVEVTETGTEAAAATAVVVGVPLSAAPIGPQPPPPPRFEADRPFMYLIREKSTGAILFMGRYTGK